MWNALTRGIEWEIRRGTQGLGAEKWKLRRGDMTGDCKWKACRGT